MINIEGIMFKYLKKTHRLRIFCPHCRQNLDLSIPDHIFQQDAVQYPFTFRYVHGKPPHSVTLFIDKNDDIRGYEFGDSIQLSDDIIENLFQQRNLTEDPNSELILKSIFNTYTTVIEAHLPNAEAINFEIGEKLGRQFEALFKATDPSPLFQELQTFWRKNAFGEMDEISIDKDMIKFKVYECFECSHLPELGYPVCKLDEGFLTALLQTKFQKKYLVQEIECFATGKNYCEFQVKEHPLKM